MSTLSEILNEVYCELSLSENIDRSPLSCELTKKEFEEIWKIETEIEVGSFLKEVSLIIAFDKSFPLSLPKIYLSRESFNTIFPLPHVDKNRFVCTFHSDSLILDTDNPLGIVRLCLRKAKTIIKAGLEGTNHGEFKDELSAYWTDNEESDIIHYVSLIYDFPKETTCLKICKLIPALNHIKYVVYRNKNDFNAKNFLEFALSKGCKGTESDALFLFNHDIGYKPPFPEINQDVLNSLSPKSLFSFKNYINSFALEKHIFFLAETTTKPILLGWKHKVLTTKRDGFRPGSLTAFDVLSKYQKKDKIERICVNEYSNNRIENRTSGMVNTKFTFVVAGLGSIGSHLIYFLNGLNYPSFKLIDDDILKIENIGRHLLGINNIHTFKTVALKEYIKNIRPDQDVSIKSLKLETVILENSTYFNDCSFAFIAIGNQNIENFLMKKQLEGLITIPMFFFWVEPYAIGGHCIFIHPDDKYTLADLYDNHFYRYNLIDSAEYLKSNPILSKQEAGCQTSYTPYSGNDVVLFLSTIYKWLKITIQNNSKQSMVIQWTGNIDLAKDLGISLNKPYVANESYSINTFYLNNDSNKK